MNDYGGKEYPLRSPGDIKANVWPLKKISFVVMALAALWVTNGCSSKGTDYQGAAESELSSAHVTVSFDFEKQSGYASNQFAVWVEDADGKLVRTLYATRFTSTGGYKTRPDSVPLWVEKSGLASMSAADVDAITSATPKSGRVSYAWDLSDSSGNTVPDGDYTYYVEGSLRWKNRVLYKGAITTGGGQSVSEAAAEYTFEADEGQPKLSEDSPETKMLAKVQALFAPAD